MNEMKNVTPGACGQDLYSSQRSKVLVCNALFISGFFFLPLAGPICAVILAYAWENREEPITASHFRFLINSFWGGLITLGILAALTAIGMILTVVLIGIAILILVGIGSVIWYVWLLIRHIISVVRMIDNQPMNHPQSLWVE